MRPLEKTSSMMQLKKLVAALPKASALLALMAFYLATRPLAIHVSDSYAWVNTVETESYYYFFHPHHVLYVPLAWRWTQIVTFLLPNVGTWTALSALSAVFACAGVAAVYRTMRLVGAASAASLVASAAAAFSFGFWFFASEPEVYVLSSACGLWAICFLAHFAAAGGVRTAGWAGVAAGLAALFHQTGIFLFVPAVVVFAFTGRSRRPFAAGTLFTAAFAALVTPVYLAAAWAATGTLAPLSFVRWIFLFGGEGYGGFSAAAPWQSLVGLARSIVGGQSIIDALRGARAGTAREWAGAASALAGAAMFAALAVKAARRLRKMDLPARALVPAAAAGFAVYGFFSAWFDPANFEWWTIPLPLLVLVVAIPALRGPKPALVTAALAVLFIASANIILDFSYRRNPDVDLVRNASRAVASVAGPEDVIVVPPYLGSVLWYENRNLKIFCPEKEARRTNVPETIATLSAKLHDAARSGGRLVIAGSRADEKSRWWAEAILASFAEDDRKVIGTIKFFDGGRRLVATVSEQPVIAVDAALFHAPRAESLVASAEVAPCR